MKFISNLLFLFIFPATSVMAQPGFNNAYDLGWINNHFRDMIVDNDTIIGYGIVNNIDTSMNWEQGLILSKFDSLGNHLFSNIITDPQGDRLSIDKTWGKITPVSDGGYIMTAAPFYRNGTLLIKVDHDLQLEFMKEYSDTVNLSHFLYKKPVELEDGYLLYGSLQRPNYELDPFIRRVDQQGNTIWFNYYGNYDLDDNFNDCYQVNDSLFVFAGSKNLGEQTYRSTITYIDWHGNIINTWESEPNPETGSTITKILLTEDGKYIIYGLYLVEVIGNTLIVQPTVARLDSDFQVEWVNHFGVIGSIAGRVNLWSMELTSDGNYIGAGESIVVFPDDPDIRAGWLYKFSPQGITLWSKTYHPPFPINNQNRGWLTGVGELSSGNFVAGGTAFKGQKYHPWLIKVTPNGCLDTLCELATSTQEMLEQFPEPVVYPNPSEGPLTLEFPLTISGRQLRLSLMDAKGSIIWQEERSMTRRLELNMERVPSGLYYLRIQLNDRQWVKKVLVQ